MKARNVKKKNNSWVMAMSGQLRKQAVQKRVDQMKAAIKGGVPLTTDEIMQLDEEYREHYITCMQE